MGCMPGPSGTTCGEEVTFDKSNLGSNGMEVQERKVVTSPEQKLVALAMANTVMSSASALGMHLAAETARAQGQRRKAMNVMLSGHPWGMPQRCK